MTTVTSASTERPTTVVTDPPGRTVRGRTLTFTCSAHGETAFASFGFATINLACGCQWTASGGGTVTVLKPTEYRGTHGSWYPNRRKALNAVERRQGFYGEIIIPEGEPGAGWEWHWTNGHNFDVAEGRLR